MRGKHNMTTNNSNSNSNANTIEALATARRGFVEASGVIRGAMRSYVAMLCTAFGDDWLDAYGSDSANAKPLKASVNKEREALYDGLKVMGHSNPSVYWARVKADVPLYLAEKALEVAKAKAEGKPAKGIAAKRVAEAAAKLDTLKAGKAEKRKPGGAPASGEAPKAGGKVDPFKGMAMAPCMAFVSKQLELAKADKAPAFTPELRRGLASLAELLAAYFTAAPMDKLEADIGKPKGRASK
jgi:hypothetical protein